MRWLRVFLGSCVFGLVGLGVPALVSSLIMTVVKKDNECTRGMIFAVKHLVEVTEA